LGEAEVGEDLGDFSVVGAGLDAGQAGESAGLLEAGAELVPGGQ
jgi:hypothetical protein